jgi:hypothetical protein
MITLLILLIFLDSYSHAFNKALEILVRRSHTNCKASGSLYNLMPNNFHCRRILLRTYDNNLGLIGQSWESVSDSNTVDFSQAQWVVSGTIYQVGGWLSICE